ncbi:MAG: hypothetical protein AAF713_01855 [Pseudomonadota bacterium]
MMIPKHDNQRFTQEERRYYAWLHELPCCLSMVSIGVQVAHTGGLSEGKGVARKADLQTCLPLHYRLHYWEERNRRLFWRQVGVDPIRWSAKLYQAFAEGSPTRIGTGICAGMAWEANPQVVSAMMWETVH